MRVPLGMVVPSLRVMVFVYIRLMLCNDMKIKAMESYSDFTYRGAGG